jgi:protein involved in ribonucleotide reduction
MKRIILLFCFLSMVLTSSFAQNKKAVRDSINRVKYEKAVAAVEAKDFVIIVDTYDTGGGNFDTNTDVANFLSYEKEFVYVQGQIIAGNGYTNKLTVSEYSKVVDKKGNIKISMQVRGNFINGKIEISLNKGFDNADVILTPTKGDFKRFSGALVPKAESKYFKRSGEI